MYVLLALLVGLIAGYAFRGLIHKEVIKYGARLKNAARRGDNYLDAEAKKLLDELKAKF